MIDNQLITIDAYVYVSCLCVTVISLVSRSVNAMRHTLIGQVVRLKSRVTKGI